MSLLDAGPAYEACTVYVETTSTDVDGNTRTKPSASGIAAVARFQVSGQSGTSARRSEQDNEGFESEKVYKVRFSRSFPYTLGAQSKIVWRGASWAVFGDLNRYNGSSNTRRVTYTIKRY